MNLNKRLYFVPYLTPILILIVIGLFNTKESTKIKILVWETPILSIGTYMSISAISGFTISTLVFSSFNSQKEFNYKNVVNANEYKNMKTADQFNNIKSKQDNEQEPTLIERDLNSPAPTVSVPFRIVSNEKYEDRNLYRSFNKDEELDYNQEEFEEDKLSKRNEPLEDLIADDWELPITESW